MYNYPNPSLFTRGLNFTRSINWSGLLDGTQKTLGVINQAIPVFHQIKPVISNAKTMFRIAGELKKNDKPLNNNIKNNTNTNFNNNDTNRPIFYI